MEKNGQREDLDSSWRNGDSKRFWKQRKKEKLKLKSIQKLGIIKSDPGNFLAFLDDSFWVIGGERIGFVHGSTNYRVGKQLDIRSAENLVRVMDSAIKAYSKA